MGTDVKGHPIPNGTLLIFSYVQVAQSRGPTTNPHPEDANVLLV